jgi:membrane fusion protein (multidrug efflux system)
VLGVIAVAVLGSGGTWWATHAGREATDDAQIDGEVVAVPALVAGTVTRVLFTENQPVKAGDVLAELDDETFRAKLAQAEATLAAAEASADAAEADAQVAEANAVGNKSVARASLQAASAGAATTDDHIHEGEAQVRAAEASLKKAEMDRDRARRLFEGGGVARSELDEAQTVFDLATSSLDAARAHLTALRLSAAQARGHVAEASAKLLQASDVDTMVRLARARAKAARAQADAAKAARDLAALDLEHTRVRAPRDGVVSKKTIAAGQAIAASQPVVQLVTPDVWVTANFKETQLARMRAGQPAEVEVDAFPGAKLHGEVESFSGATGSRFTLLPPDNASGNFTKVVQRVPVRVHLRDVPSSVALRPGMSVELSVDTRR